MKDAGVGDAGEKGRAKRGMKGWLFALRPFALRLQPGFFIYCARILQAFA